jgi:hypothetical protein
MMFLVMPPPVELSKRRNLAQAAEWSGPLPALSGQQRAVK